MDLSAVFPQDVRWSFDGQSQLVLRLDANGQFLVLDLEHTDARRLTRLLQGDSQDRLAGVVLDLLADLDARLREVVLAVGADGLLRARLIVDGPRGEISAVTHVTDGLLLAWQGHRPVQIAAHDLPEPSSADGLAVPAAFRAALETLE